MDKFVQNNYIRLLVKRTFSTQGFRMLEITGPTSTGCHGITRRDLLRVGSLGLGGLTLPGLLRA